MNWVLLKNSLLVALAATFGAVLLGSLAALWVAALGRHGRRFCLMAAVVALALPPFLVTNAWLDLLGQAGRWHAWLPVDIYSLGGTVWVLALLLWPISLLLVLASMQKIEPSQLEVEPALRGWALIRCLLLPMAWPAMVQASALTFVLALNNFAVPAILQTKVFPAELWVSFNTTFDYRSALALSWPLLVAPALLFIVLRRKTLAWPRAEGALPSGLLRRRLGVAAFALAGMITALGVLLSTVLPLAQLVTSGRTWLELPGALAAGHEAVLHSLAFAALSAALCLAAGLVLWRWRIGAVLWVPFLLPGVLLGMGIIFAFNRPWLAGFYQSSGIVFLALALRYAGLGWSAAGRARGSVDPRLTDFARLHGARAWQLFRHVHWPQIGPEMAAAWFIVYLLCLWDVETLVLIIPPGAETLALRIFNLLHYGHNAQVNALCVLLLGLALLPLAAWPLVRAGTKARAARRIFACLAALAPVWLLASCAPPNSETAPVHSQFFSKVRIIGGRGTALGQFNKPRSLTVDAHDNLYVVDMTGRVQKFSSNGVYLASWQMPEIERGKPKGMCQDAAGNIVVVEPHYSRVNHFTPEGKLVAQWGVHGTNAGQLTLPRAAAVNSHGDILVCEYTLVDRVQIFSPEGKRFKAAFGHSGLGPGEFNRPEGIAVDRTDRVYVADSCNHRVQIFSPEGNFVCSYGRAGSGPGELSYPYDIQTDSAGRQFVCEFGNSRIQIFDERGRPLETLGGPGAAPGQFSNPWSIALDSAGNLYVADSQNHRVQKFFRK